MLVIGDSAFDSLPSYFGFGENFTPYTPPFRVASCALTCRYITSGILVIYLLRGRNAITERCSWMTYIIAIWFWLWRFYIWLNWSLVIHTRLIVYPNYDWFDWLSKTWLVFQSINAVALIGFWKHVTNPFQLQLNGTIGLSTSLQNSPFEHLAIPKQVMHCETKQLASQDKRASCTQKFPENSCSIFMAVCTHESQPRILESIAG